MPQTEKQLTAMMILRDFVSDGLDNYDESIKVSEIWQKINELLATERQQLESAVKYGQDNKTVFAPCNYMEITFKTQ